MGRGRDAWAFVAPSAPPPPFFDAEECPWGAQPPSVVVQLPSVAVQPPPVTVRLLSDTLQPPSATAQPAQ